MSDQSTVLGPKWMVKGPDHPFITALYCIYNERDLLYESVLSVLSFVDEIVFLDGRYEGFPNESAISDDGTRDLISGPICEMCLGRGIKAALANFAGKERDKRNHLFSLCRTPYGFVIDGDEIFYGNPTCVRNFLRQGVRIGFLQVLFGRGAKSLRPRLFSMRAYPEYKAWWKIRVDEEVLDLHREGWPPEWVVPSCGIVDLYSGYRTKERDDQRVQWQTEMIKKNWEE